jgi:cell division protein FtsL
MPAEKLVVLILVIVLLVQTIVVGWLGWQYYQVQKKLEGQQEKVETPAMIRGKI